MDGGDKYNMQKIWYEEKTVHRTVLLLLVFGEVLM
jgi:hypothetical protein